MYYEVLSSTLDLILDLSSLRSRNTHKSYTYMDVEAIVVHIREVPELSFFYMMVCMELEAFDNWRVLLNVCSHFYLLNLNLLPAL